jgi:hypothetical protein
MADALPPNPGRCLFVWERTLSDIGIGRFRRWRYRPAARQYGHPFSKAAQRMAAKLGETSVTPGAEFAWRADRSVCARMKLHIHPDAFVGCPRMPMADHTPSPFQVCDSEVWHVQYRRDTIDHSATHSSPEAAIETACRLIDDGCDVYGIGTGPRTDSIGQREIARIYALWARAKPRR